MMHRLWISLLLCAGCDELSGEPGPAGEPGAMGDPGPTGPQGAAVTLVGADGEAVHGFGDGAFATIVDDDGNLWVFRGMTGAFVPRTTDVYYSEVGCAGTAFVSADLVQPRYPFSVPGETELRVVADDATTMSNVDTLSLRGGAGDGTCFDNGRTDLSVTPLPPVANVSVPVAPFVPPLHLELATGNP